MPPTTTKPITQSPIAPQLFCLLGLIYIAIDNLTTTTGSTVIGLLALTAVLLDSLYIAHQRTPIIPTRDRINRLLARPITKPEVRIGRNYLILLAILITLSAILFSGNSTAFTIAFITSVLIAAVYTAIQWTRAHAPTT